MSDDRLDTKALRLAATYRLGIDLAERLTDAAEWQLKQAAALEAAADEIDRLRGSTPSRYAVVLEGEHWLDDVHASREAAEAVASPFRDAGRKAEVVPLYARAAR